MALRSLNRQLYGQPLNVNGHIVRIGNNGVITAPPHIEAELLTQPENWVRATEADLALPADLAPPPPVQNNIQKVLEGQRLMAHQPLVHTPSQMQQLTDDHIVRPIGNVLPAAAPVAPPPLASTVVAPPIEPTVDPQVLGTPPAPTAPIAPPPSVATGKPAIMRGRTGKRADAL